MFKSILHISFIIILSFSLMAFSWGSKYKTVKPNSKGIISIAINQINDGKAHYFETKVNGKSIRFFALKSKDGIIRAAFDACDVCYRSKKGYRQDGDFMICNNCGMKFHSTRINVVKGGCNPSPLRRFNDGKFLHVTIRDIASGAFYF